MVLGYHNVPKLHDCIDNDNGNETDFPYVIYLK